MDSDVIARQIADRAGELSEEWHKGKGEEQGGLLSVLRDNKYTPYATGVMIGSTSVILHSLQIRIEMMMHEMEKLRAELLKEQE